MEAGRTGGKGQKGQTPKPPVLSHGERTTMVMEATLCGVFESH